MTKQTYGNNGNLPGVTVTTDGSLTDMLFDGTDDAIGTAMPPIQLWGHSIILDGENGIKCQMCGMSEEIPAIFQQSSGFREVVYKMYVLGKFKHANCEQEFETDQSVLHDDVTNIGYDPNKTHWVGGNTTTTTSGDISRTADATIPAGQHITIGPEEYEYQGQGVFMERSTGKQHHALDLCHKHGSDAFTSLPPHLADACKMHLADQSAVDKTVDGPIGVGDVQGGAPDMAGVDTSIGVTDNSVTMQAADAMSEQEKQGIVQKAAKALKEQRNPLTRK